MPTTHTIIVPSALASADGLRSALESRLEEKHRAYRRAIDLVLELFEEDPGLFADFVSSRDGTRISSPAPRHNDNGKTNIEMVEEALRTRPGTHMTPGEIHQMTGLTEGAIRTVFYTKTDKFEKKHLGPRRVAWRLKE